MKTKTRARRPAASYRPRRSSVRHRKKGGGWFSSWAGKARLARTPSTFWLAAIGVLVIGVSSPFLVPLIVDGFRGLLKAFGAVLILLVVALCADAVLVLRRPAVGPAFWRIWVGTHLALLFLFGLGGFFSPEFSISGVSLDEVSAGGRLGKLLAGSPVGVVALVLIAVGALELVYPPALPAACRKSMSLARFIVSLHIPQRIWGATRSFVGNLIPQADDYDEEVEPPPYVSNWDEEWGEQKRDPVAENAPPAVEKVQPTTPEQAEQLPLPQVERSPVGRPGGHGWQLPPMAYLAEAEEIEVRPVDNELRAQLIVDTLASFGVDARVVAINQGPTVTQFGIEPGWETKTRVVAIRDERGRPVYDRDGKPQMRTEVVSKTRVRVNRITALANDLALALAAPTIRIEAPVPGKPVVGIEVPNTTTSLVSLRSVIEATSFQRIAARSKLAIALGKGVSGEPVSADLGKMPHLLIAGATGSGKSVCINSIIACLLLHATPEELRLVLIDPKRVEMTTYSGIPHLAFSKVITDVEEVVGTLQAVIHEMDTRYRRFAEIGVRNLEGYNKSPRAIHKLPYWVVIIDELADLMMAAPYQVERQICRLAQLARATGIHLIVATQRPSVDVVTGLIKANFPTRVAFAVSSQVDSRTIIDGGGAEKLLGRGDMLFMATDAGKPRRLQGSYVSDQELEQIVVWWTNDNFRHLRPEPMDYLLQEVKTEAEAEEAAVEEDPLYEAARELTTQHSRISTSLLQRRLHIGYPRAARLIDQLEEEGIISAAEGGQSREVLSAADEFSREE